jgi:hypothetical protein
MHQQKTSRTLYSQTLLMAERSFLRILLAAVLLTAALTATVVPCISATLPDGSIKVRAEARVEALTKGEAHPQLHWVLVSRPAAPDVSFPNPVVQPMVLQAIRETFANPESCVAFALEARITCSFPGALITKLKAISFGQAAPTKAPTGPGQTLDFELRFQFVPPHPPKPTTITSLSVSITTDLLDKTGAVRPQDSCSAQPASNNCFQTTWWAAARITKMPDPPDQLAAIPIFVEFTQKDLDPPSDIIGAQRALLEVGVVALQRAQTANCLPGAPEPSDNVMLGLQTSLQQQFRAPVPGWPAPVVAFRHDSAGNYTIHVHTIRIVSAATVEIVRGQIAGAKGMVDFVGKNASIEKKIQDELARAASEAEGDIAPQLNDLSGHVPTVVTVEAARKALSVYKLVSGGVDVRAAGSNIILSGTRRWSMGKLNADASLTGSITPEDFVTGKASLDASNLIRNILPVPVGETYNLSVQGGSEVQRATLDFSIPRTYSKNWLKSFGFTHSLLFTRDAKQRFGDDNPKVLPLIYRQMGMMPQLFFELNRVPGDPWLFSARAAVSYDWRSVLIAPRTAGAANLVDGQLAAPTAELKLITGHDSNTGFVGSTRLEIDATGRRGTHALAGDFAFEQFTISARGEVFFGAERNSDFFLRYERGLGMSGAGTPLFELMRLGGPTNVRGLENGEFIGRNLAYDQSGAGVSVAAITNTFHKAAGGKSPVVGGFDLANVYVVGLYDRGRVTNAGNLGDLLSVGPAAHSYGIAGELRKMPANGKLANLTIGWARSPQSGLHSHGVMTLGVSMDF